MDDQYKDFPAALTAAREAAGLTQKELGDKIGKSQQAVAKWENGESNPTRRSMGQLISVLPSLAKLELPALPPKLQVVQTATGAGKTLTGAAAIDGLRQAGAPDSHLEATIRKMLPPELQQYLRWNREIDYESEKAVVEICSLFLRMHPAAFAHRLWRLSTLRLKNNDRRGYYLLLVRTDGSGSGLTYHQQRDIARYTAEANIHGITLLTADSPLNAAEILHAIESDAGGPDSTTDNNFYEDQEPHE